MSMNALLRCEWRRVRVRAFFWVMAAVVIAGMAWELILMLGPFLAQQQKLIASGTDIGYTDLVLLPWLAFFVIPAILMAPLATMSTLAGERRRGTLALLMASGLSPLRIVLGKYLAALGWLLLILLVVLVMPAALAFAGAPDWGKLAAAALGLVLLLGLLTAIGMAASAHSTHPALAAAIALVVSSALLLVNRGSLQQGVIGGVANWLALPTHLQPMGRGLVSSVDVAWFVIGTVLALALAVHRVAQEKDRD
ncbi:MAG TPA: ABC transporter permease subunit [Oleiagrimonas sp.]|nr:ABC transporter permease subunit [Oleiagrimonas sp.]